MKRGWTVALGALLLAWAAFPVTPDEAAARLEKALRGPRTLRARFEQSYYSVSVTEPLRERGELFLQKPDRMRWQYRSPQEKVFLYGGGVLQVYLAEDKQLTRSKVRPEAYDSDIVGIFLASKSFRDLYVIEDTRFPTDTARVRQIKLTPKEEGDYSHILLEIDDRTWLPRRAIFLEWAGSKREFFFTDVRTNVKLSAKLFELKVPAGTEVIDETGTAKR
ncbi:MAG TPA: outer membrane lipoprotein carrier protein LolA [Terriglobales bacterium]|nr:outer membrane lipoprotein carrier protein LolA [Terriglobales bacterium]